ncbi:hypothetical protein A2U01_0049894, partial [Trifolium medium]|nr:hypothetical protein [Trifolium medium]
MANIMAKDNQPGREDEVRLERFMKHKPPTFTRGEEANHWWKNAKQRIGAGGVVITWEMFKRDFLIKYFPADVRNRKVVEFMELKQGNMSVAEYAVKFESLCAFSPHFNTPEAEYDKCVKFESGLRPD